VYPRGMSPEQLPPLRGRATITTVVIIVALIALCLVLWAYRNTPPLSNLLGSKGPTSAEQETPKSTVAYVCDNNKKLTAVYYDGPATVAHDGAPMPGGHVQLTLTDGTMMSLPQTQSGSGIRYANTNENFVFWSKGNTAFVEEGTNQKQTYTGCIALATPAPGEESWEGYASSKYGFSILYPKDYTVDPAYEYMNMGPSKPTIKGVKFTIPAALAAGTNLSTDSNVTVETLPNSKTCSAGFFTSMPTDTHTMVENGVEYSIAETADAAAGNLYTEMIYAVVGSAPCTAVRYLIHSTQFANYPAGTRTEFDKGALLVQFDQIRHSLVLGQQ
jgi:membrane-bound inhibitor of C-type lysozyme